MSDLRVSVPSPSENQMKIYSEFLKIRKEKPTEKITVVEICKSVGINRSTFYRSFYDVYDLEEKIEDYCAGSVARYFCGSLDFSRFSNCDGNKSFEKILLAFDDRVVIEALRVLNGSQRLYEKVLMCLLEEATFLKSERKKSELLKTAFCFVVTGALYSYRENSYCKKFEISEVMLISFTAFKAFYDKIMNEEEFDPLPISENENRPVKAKKERLNVKKTKRSLKRAFLELALKKGGSRIGVSELCEKAEISNSTFYLHFNGIDDYVKSLSDEMIENFYGIAKTVYSQMGEDKLKIRDLILYVEKAKSIFCALNKSKKGEEFYKYPQIFIDSFFDFIDKDYCSSFDSKTAFSFVCYCTWGMLFEPLYDHDLSTGYIFNMAYFVFINLFEQKAALKEIKEKQ